MYQASYDQSELDNPSMGYLVCQFRSDNQMQNQVERLLKQIWDAFGHEDDDLKLYDPYGNRCDDSCQVGQNWKS